MTRLCGRDGRGRSAATPRVKIPSPVLRWLRNKWQRDLVTMRERKVKAAQQHRDRKILCPRCGYDIKGAPDQPCSECGLFIESKWSEGRFAAGSGSRRMVPWIMGYLGLRTFLLYAAYAVLINPVGVAISARAWEIDPLFWVTDAAWLTHALVGLGMFVFAITKYRPFVYGPRPWAIRMLVLWVVLLLGTDGVFQHVVSVRAQGI